jgi:hypothetical protein
MIFVELTHFMGLIYLEGELLVEDNHPILSEFFHNEFQISKGKSFSLTKSYWELIYILLENAYLKFNWRVNKDIGKNELLKIFLERHNGKC